MLHVTHDFAEADSVMSPYGPLQALQLEAVPEQAEHTVRLQT